MPICELIKFWLQLLLGGPSIMASYAQQQQRQQQCIKKNQQLRQWFKLERLVLRTCERQQQQQCPRHKLPRFNSFLSTCSSSSSSSSSTSTSRSLSILQQQIFPKFFSFSFLLFILLSSVGVAFGEGNVGCLFVRTLCLESTEVCFDDNIFGKCISTTGVDVEDIEKSALSSEQSNLLATMLEELQGAGLGWDHPYVQCRIQGTLYSMLKQTQLPPNLCANLAPTPTDIDPAGVMAFVRFTPPNQDYVDVNDLFYYPPLKKQTHQFDTEDNSIGTILRQLQLQDRQLRHDPLELAHFGKLDALNSQVEQPSVMDVFLETERERIQREQQQREAELKAEHKQAVRNRLEPYQIFAASEPDPEPFQRNPPKPTPIDKLERSMEQQGILPILVPEALSESNEFYFPENYRAFKRVDQNSKRKQNTHTFFRELAATEAQQPPVSAFKRIPNNGYDELNANEQQQLEEEQQQKQWEFEQNLLRNSLKPFEEEAVLTANNYAYRHKPRKPERVYTEGGLIFVPERHLPHADEQNSDEYEQQKAAETRELFELLGFKRRERLDVKKPGPLIGPPQMGSEANDLPTTAIKDENKPKAETKEVLPAHIKDKYQTSKKRKFAKDHSDEDHAPHSVDTEYAHVFVKNPIDSWNDGVRIVNELANILHMQGYFTYLTVQPHDVSFRVNSNNPERKTASDIVRIINENRGVKNNLLRRLGVTMQRAGVGDKAKLDADGGVSAARIELAAQGPDVTHIMAYMFAGAGAAAVIVIFITLILIKRHDKKRDKLGGLQTGNAGAESCSKDYQELCRARMAGKGNAAEPVASGRITTLSKENDRPPSSRSSTSSWSEEPAMTNMDISTGHMVLSYMEDHLRNKGRLQREWEALCRYEAEPSARDAAQQAQCANFNRTGAPLPYDHSRVVLNHLANAEGLDYVNASTITDHDPRAPAYVAAQGPLPATLAHFWQMIWEQGAVVIVALCRLQENGEIACARYWPEEGAEVYHIYEVHLVSEHIWCDDYLVRSFYLKNLRTSETRTVTQFHFLSWPQAGVPAQAKALLDFRRKVNKSYRGRSCPIVVHSSHGAGRTGAYILLDLVLGRMNKGAREIDIAATLEHLRDQRAGLVATRQQFEFVLMAVAEEVHAILKALPANQSNEKRELDTKETTNGTLKEEETAADEEVATTSKMAENDKEKDKTKTDKDKEKDKKAKTASATTPAKTTAPTKKK